MTIDECINDCEKIMFGAKMMQQSEVYKYNSQLAEWLKDYKRLLEQQPCEDKGELSDGYHTFNQLYHQRAILFATIVNQNKDKAWKSYKHSDGKYCFDSNGEWFIVGVDTSEGSYTYHYSKEYWDYFDCKELDCGKEWDGHTEEDVIRLLSLEQEPCEDAISRQAVLDGVAIIAKAKAKSDAQKSLMGRVLFFTEHLPSVTPQPRAGYWVSIDEEPHEVYECDRCGRVVSTFTTNIEPHIEYKYCPNCGAKMVEPQEGVSE